jgi:hypothetical protein
MKVTVTTGVNLTPEGAAATAATEAFRQSLHSVAGFEPKEKPLNSLPHCGQIGNWKFPLSAASDLPCDDGNPTIRVRHFQFK